MTPTEEEDMRIAQEAYTIWRGGHRTKLMPAHWDVVGPEWRECFGFIVAHARHFELAAQKKA